VIIDLWPHLVKGKKYGREVLAAVVCVVIMLIGLPILSQGGIYIFELYNTYAASGITLLWLAMCESIAIGWVYGADRYYDDMESMLGFRPHAYFKYCYKYFIPIITFGIFLFFCINSKPLVLGAYVYPSWANSIGWIMSLVSMLCVPAGIFYYFANNGWSYSRAASEVDLDDSEQKYGEPEYVIRSSTISTTAGSGEKRDIEMQIISPDALPLNI